MKFARIKLLLCIFLQLSLSSCADLKAIMGIKESNKDFPPGEYVGVAQLITPGSEDSNGSTEVAVSSAPTPTPAVTPAPNEATPPDAANGTAVQANGTPALTTIVAEPELKGDPIKVTFLPRKGDMVDGVGVLLLHNNSERFYWRSDGNNANTWNVLLTKDQNLYTNIQHTFKFDGLITASEVENKLVGRLHVNYDSQEADYYIQAFQYFKPEIIPPKEAISIKAGDPVVIDVNRIGSDDDAIIVMIKSATDGTETPLAIQGIVRSDKGIKITLTTDKQLAKGDYSLWLTRVNKHKSNKIPLKVA